MSRTKMTSAAFLRTWKKHSRKKKWATFHEAMSADSVDAGFEPISERSLSVRCGAINRSLDNHGYISPAYPKKPKDIASAAVDLGLRKKPVKKPTKKRSRSKKSGK